MPREIAVLWSTDRSLVVVEAFCTFVIIRIIAVHVVTVVVEVTKNKHNNIDIYYFLFSAWTLSDEYLTSTKSYSSNLKDSSKPGILKLFAIQFTLNIPSCIGVCYKAVQIINWTKTLEDKRTHSKWKKRSEEMQTLNTVNNAAASFLTRVLACICLLP